MVGSSTKDGIATLMIKPAYPIQQHKGPKFGPGIDVIGGRLAFKKLLSTARHAHSRRWDADDVC